MAALRALAITLLPLFTSAVTLQSATLLGNFTTNPDDKANVRDLGFVGQINGIPIATFGDILICDDEVHQTGCGLGPVAANGAGRILSATTYRDTPNSAKPQQFCQFFSDEEPSQHGMGITPVIATSESDGVLYFLNIKRNLPGFPSDYSYAVGAGVAHITFTIDGTGTPVCTRLAHNWWNGQSEPWYGDKSSFIAKDLSYIYAIGGCNSSTAGGDYRFVSRVPVANATSLAAHQYWNGNAWTSTRITANSVGALRDTTGAIMLDANQGQIAWNKHLSKYIWLDTNYFDSYVRIRTADNPQGPWTQPQDLFSPSAAGGCPSPNKFYTPTYDVNWYSGDTTFVVHVTCVPNMIQSFKVTLA